MILWLDLSRQSIFMLALEKTRFWAVEFVGLNAMLFMASTIFRLALD